MSDRYTLLYSGGREDPVPGSQEEYLERHKQLAPADEDPRGVPERDVHREDPAKHQVLADPGVRLHAVEVKATSLRTVPSYLSTGVVQSL